MLTNPYLLQLKRELQKRGIFGEAAERLLEELADHAESAKMNRAPEVSADEAEKEAWTALGNTAVVAASAVDFSLFSTLARQRPFLSLAVLFALFLSLVILFDSALAGTIWLSVNCLHLFHLASPTVGRAINSTFSWGPQILSLCCLCWMGSRFALGWRLLLPASAVAGIATAVCTVHFHAGDGLAHLTLRPSALFADVWHGMVPLLRAHWSLSQLRNAVHLAFPFGACLIAREALFKTSRVRLIES